MLDIHPSSLGPSDGRGARALAVSAPGKLILMGEHAVVYGRPALVAALGLRLAVRLGVLPSAPAGAVHLDLPPLGLRAEIPWPEILAYARAARERWQRYAEAPSPESFRALRGNDPLHLVKVALGEAAAELGEPSPPPLSLRVDSEIPPGAGFGSSAAAAVALVAAFLALLAGPEPDPMAVERLAHEVERRQHGTPSGVDAATVLRGGVLWARRQPEEGAPGVAIEPVAVRSRLLGRLRLYDTGAPPEPTGEVVAAVRARREREPARCEALLDRMAAATAGLRAELEAAAEDPERTVELVRDLQARLEELGVVPAPVRALVRRVEAAGGAAKISGAGSLDGPGAGALLVYGPDPERAASWPFLAHLPVHPVPLGAAGLRREETR